MRKKEQIRQLEMKVDNLAEAHRLGVADTKVRTELTQLRYQLQELLNPGYAVTAIVEKPTSFYYGNPRFELITLDHGTYRTVPDAAVSYDVENWWSRPQWRCSRFPWVEGYEIRGLIDGHLVATFSCFQDLKAFLKHCDVKWEDRRPFWDRRENKFEETPT